MKTQKQLENLVASLPEVTDYNKPYAHDTYPLITSKPTARIEDGLIYVSAEDGKATADYYGEFRGGYPWINPVLEEWATKNGGYWEWQNPGEIVFCPN